MADYHLVPVDHDPFAGQPAPGVGSDAPSLNQWGQPLVRDVSPEERYRFQPDVPEAVKRTAMGEGAYQNIQTGRKWGGRSYDMTPAEREAYTHGFTHASSILASFVNPAFGTAGLGLEAAGKYAQGDKQGALETAATAAVPYAAAAFPKTAAAAAGAFLGNPATATGGGLIDGLPENERAMYADQLKQARRIRDLDQRNAATAAVNAKITDRVTKLRDQERELANSQAAAQKWMDDNAASIGSLDDHAAAQVRSANPADRPGLLNKFLEEKRRAGMTFAEKHADWIDPMRAAVVGGSFLAPAVGAARRANSLAAADANAAAAWRAANTGRMTKAKRADLELARNNLFEKAGGSPVDPKEMALGALAPYAAGVFAPNSIDIMSRLPSIPVPTWLGGSGESPHPEDWDIVKRAGWSMINPGALVPLGEGAIASGVGRWLGGVYRDWGDTMSGARGTLSTIEAELNKRAASTAKAAATRAANKAAQQSNVVSGGSLGSATNPATAPKPRRKP